MPLRAEAEAFDSRCGRTSLPVSTACGSTLDKVASIAFQHSSSCGATATTAGTTGNIPAPFGLLVPGFGHAISGDYRWRTYAFAARATSWWWRRFDIH
jgi:hypothetical protein